MAQLQVKDISQELLSKWKVMAAQQGLTLKQYVIGSLERGQGAPNTCYDCGGKLGDMFKMDEDNRTFHHGCGGAEYAKRMSEAARLTLTQLPPVATGGTERETDTGLARSTPVSRASLPCRILTEQELSPLNGPNKYISKRGFRKGKQ